MRPCLIRGESNNNITNKNYIKLETNISIKKIWLLSELSSILTWSTAEESRQIAKSLRNMEESSIRSGIMAVESEFTETLNSRQFTRLIKVPKLWNNLSIEHLI